MSWKIRRAHYYARQKGRTGADPETAKCLNFWFYIAIVLSFIALAMRGMSTDNSIILFIRAIGGLGFLATPFFLIFALIGETLQHGLPDFKNNKLSKKNLNDEGESIWNQWIEEDKNKK